MFMLVSIVGLLIVPLISFVYSMGMWWEKIRIGSDDR